MVNGESVDQPLHFVGKIVLLGQNMLRIKFLSRNAPNHLHKFSMIQVHIHPSPGYIAMVKEMRCLYYVNVFTTTFNRISLIFSSS